MSINSIRESGGLLPTIGEGHMYVRVRKPCMQLYSSALCGLHRADTTVTHITPEIRSEDDGGSTEVLSDGVNFTIISLSPARMRAVNCPTDFASSGL